MDKKLKEAINKGKSEKKKKEHKEEKERAAKQSKHQEYIKSYLPKARKWIEEKLFTQIAEEEASKKTYRSIYLGSGHRDGIPVEAIYEAAKDIKGLHPTYTCGTIYENAEAIGVGEPEYSISWEETK